MPPGRSASHTPSQSRARAGRSTTNSLRRFNCIESRGWVLPLCYCNYVLSKLDELMANAATTEWEDQEETLARLTRAHDTLSTRVSSSAALSTPSVKNCNSNLKNDQLNSNKKIQKDYSNKKSGVVKFWPPDIIEHYLKW
ncbi:hypothetical protein SELMODRAFT_406243 [Selaginella moellendorffii]|uniref:Uncharacterized protein n=1 Tax=Selaginella moellendorffii TaxID=88036 RepID=D8R1R0_SELML|nr:hypothetical protein SELMODRAFT_406243 [Selaginella moellendorffii]